jgi:Uma2 family endonuclease
MTTDEFIAWALDRVDGEPRYELVDGELVAMSPERLSHTRAKFSITVALRQAIASAGLACEAIIDGVTVEIDEATAYEPDALVRCGEPLPGDTVKLSDPLIIVEVVSRSSRGLDTGTKFEDYFRLPSLRHYLVVRTDRRTVIHHTREADGRITTRIVKDGRLELDPPGLAVPVEHFFA